jgi:hypothetical protein
MNPVCTRGKRQSCLPSALEMHILGKQQGYSPSMCLVSDLWDKPTGYSLLPPAAVSVE